MKKNKLIAGAAALSMMFASCIPAHAAMWDDGLYTVQKSVPEQFFTSEPAFQETSSARVMFNGEYIDFAENSPINDNGRIKLPFRELLENIGASVSFDENQNKVSAERNNVKIEFLLGSDVISVNNAGNISEFKMDTSIDVINGRTFVPVRFMAEAFGLSVGWDNYFDTVVITDIDSYVNTLMTACSNYMQLGDLTYGINNYSSDTKLNVSLDISNSLFSETPEISNIKIDLDSQTDADKNIIKSSNLINISSFNLLETDQPMDIKDLRFSLILSGNKLYISTNLVEELAKLNPSDATLAAAAGLIKSDTWLEGDIDQLLVDYLGLDKESADLFVTMLSRPESFSNAMSAVFASFDENSSISAAAARAQVEMMSRLFGNDMFRLYQNGDGSYSYDYKLDTGAFTNYISESMGEYGDSSSAAELLSDLGFTFDVVMNGTISDSKMTCKSDMTLVIDNEAISISFNMSADQNTDIGTVDLSNYSFPQRTTKLETILSILENM